MDNKLSHLMTLATGCLHQQQSLPVVSPSRHKVGGKYKYCLIIVCSAKGHERPIPAIATGLLNTRNVIFLIQFRPALRSSYVSGRFSKGMCPTTDNLCLLSISGVLLGICKLILQIYSLNLWKRKQLRTSQFPIVNFSHTRYAYLTLSKSTLKSILTKGKVNS